MTWIQKVYASSRVFEWIYQKSFLTSFLHKLKQCYLFIHYKNEARLDSKESKLRRKGKVDKRFAELKNYKDRYKGKRCFITCTGPSLTIQDLELLKNEYVFGMNSICLIHDKTDWKPDFYGIQDVEVFDKIKQTLLKTDNGQVFAPYFYKEHRNTPNDWVYFHISGAYHLYDRYYKGHYYSKFSDDCYVTVFDGFTITYSIMQLAVYMGFDEIYLLGADCSYLGKQQHFIETGHRTADFDAITVPERLTSSYIEAKKYADQHGIKIFNATRGGYLEVYDRVKLEDVIARNEKNKISK